MRGKCNLVGWRDCRFVRASVVVVDVGVDCRVEGSMSPCSCS